MRFEVPHSVIAELRARRARQNANDDVLELHDAFCIYDGFGSPLYLTADGRVLHDPSDSGTGPIREATEDEAINAIVQGAEWSGMPELLSLIPRAPVGSRACQRCGGSRWITYGRFVTGEPAICVCIDCNGRGWELQGVQSSRAAG